MHFDCTHIQIIKMSKRPFNKIRKMEKKENIEAEQPREEPKEEQNVAKDVDVSKPPIFPPKKKIQIANADALKNNEDNSELEPKISLGSKPSLFRGKKEGKLIVNTNRNSTHIDPAEDSYREAPKPTPMVIKKRPQLDFRSKERENIVIQEEEHSQRFGTDDGREAIVEESGSFTRKLDLKIKRLNPRREFEDKQENQDQSAEFSRSRERPPLSGESYTPALLQYREINIQATGGVSQGKADKQKKRSNELKNLLNLEIDLYQQTLSIGNVTAYEIYINKIKGGYLKNSQDQAFDEKSTNACQTLSFQYSDFTNQCPQDYAVDVNRIQKLDADHLFDQFILRVAPVIEELIKPANSITEPPIFLLAFRPTFKAFMKCPYPIFIYHSEQFTLDLIVIGEKLYITEGEIESVLIMGKSIVAGLRNGQLILWNGENGKSSRLYKRIKEFTNTTNFQLPAFCSNHLEKLSPYASEVPVVSLLHDERSDFYSLDASGKIVKWTIEQGLVGSQSLKGVSVIQLRTLVQRPSLKGYSLKKRGESLYANSSLGIICLHNNEIKQKLQNEGVRVLDFQLPKRSPLVLTISENNTLQIYNQAYSHRLLRMHFLLPGHQLTQIIIPELEHENREIIILSTIYLADSAGAVYEVSLLDNQCDYSRKLGQDDDGRGEKSVIFRGINRVGETLESLKLMRDLKLKTQVLKMGINADKSVGNLKSIIEKNRQIMTLLEQQNAVII